MSGIDLEIECNPSALFRARNHRIEQLRPQSASAPFREDIQFFEPSAPAAVFQAEDTRRIRHTHCGAIARCAEEKASLWLLAQHSENRNEAHRLAVDAMLAKLRLKQRRHRRNLIGSRRRDAGRFHERKMCGAAVAGQSRVGLTLINRKPMPAEKRDRMRFFYSRLLASIRGSVFF